MSLPNDFRGINNNNNNNNNNNIDDLKGVRHSGPADLNRLSQSELIQRVRKLEGDLLKLASDHNKMIREANNRIQSQSTEIAQLKNSAIRSEEDNTELRDLCCFLDDDRQKGRKLAREWQRFGRYTASVLRQEVAAYQTKLKELDSRQQQLMSDNMELKELCLYLDEERNQNSCIQCGSGAQSQRDDGDGSSSSTNMADEFNISQNTSIDTITNPIQGLGGLGLGVSSNNNNNNNILTQVQQLQGNINASSISPREETIRGLLSNQIVEYVRRLENRVKELERQETPTAALNLDRQTANALQVLQVCQSMDIGNDIGENEKALVRKMCDVVWKKLEDNNPSKL